PPEGITVNLEGDTAEILQQFLAPDGDGAVQTRVTDEGTILYRFDTSFGPGAGLVGGTLDVFSLEDGDPAEDNSDPAAAGVGFLSNFSFTITEPTASITLPVSDDLVQEVDQTFTYTLAEGDGYEVDAAANSGTFTVTDGGTPATTPVVGVTATPATLVESEQTVLTVTFTTEGDIPAEGLVVQLQGPPRSIAEFDVNATNPRLPEAETVVDGVVVDGGSIVGTDEVAGSLFFRITDPTATITVPVFDDGPGEGTENFSFNLVDGEAYEVDAAAGSFDVTIEDNVDTPPGEIIDGTAGEDRLFGTGADDIITLLGGDDTAFGGAGNDTINGGEGDDRLAGNAGNDILSGDSGNDRAFASSGTDIVDGGSGDDRLFGGADRDILIGGSGDDFLNGGAGDDVLMGVTGRDILIGGGGADLFVFGTGDGGARVGNNLGNDLIRDFEVGVDKIGLVEGELTFADITITQSGNRTLLGVASSGETLAVLKGVDASSIGESTFEIVPNVATVDDAMTIL
ncbi:MAG: calcium-binding protein, partial [Phormidesmis sp.]